MPNDVEFSHVPFLPQNVGPNVGEIPQSELDSFQNFMSDEILMQIVKATNAYAVIYLNNKSLTSSSIWYQWKDLTLPELKAYLGIILKMAIVEKSDVKDYFSKKWTEYYPFFLDVFSRCRFLQIHWMLHVKSPEPTTGVVTQSSKISNVVEYIQQKCLLNFTPRQNVAVDESTVGFKERIAFKTYNPQKPTKWGLHVFLLSDSDNGYISCFEPYFGKTTTESLPSSDKPFTTRIVLHLVDQLLNKTFGVGYHVYADKYYTSVLLAKELLQRQVYLTGTIQKNRVGLPREVKQLKLRNLQRKVYRHSDDLMALGWKDKRLVLMLSSWHNADTTLHHLWVKGKEEEIEKPCVVIDYTSQMGGVDCSGYYCASYSFTRKTLHWWRKLFFWLLEVSVVNLFITFSEIHGIQNARQLQYRNNLIVQLVGNVRNKRNVFHGRHSTGDAAERLNKLPHFIAKAPSGRNKNCLVCSRKYHRKTTVFFCETSTRKPGLHPGECFKKYHTLTDYKQ